MNLTPQLDETSIDLSIGSLLLAMGKITPEDAERVMRLHDERGMRFGDAAKSLGLITEEDIQQVLSRQFSYPYLSSDQHNYSSELIAAYQPFSAKVEVLRAVRSQLMLHWFSTGRRALPLTSANPGEGVTYLVANLAVVFSQLGKRTLLVDANLRQPRQHEIFRITEKQGLSDILAGRAGVEVVSKINAFENLSVLSAGTLPPNPQELVSRPEFQHLINSFAINYDVILIDTPSFSAGADTYAIAAMLGGTVLVARQSSTRVLDVATAVEQLKQNGTQIVGSVLLDF
ncbi:chain length determinant protein tyrosine kinase EpsG [Methylovorus sp. MM2]|uniref:chain length determinant protein tyrosine kinase EpsG n=1 Tax=Methylovorus sp. MM2 TaxID=1848038 RepID=UPI0007E07943|nr:chain length determinant protein tyrosine kinase EpsG [Methylovorus sp. MM2]OAM51205.1 chain length determinant protein tyrosine kinase EpsG [Methylovorus sp. MM2]